MKNIYNQNLIQLYKTALLEIRKHLTVSGSELLEQSIISKDSIELIEKIVISIPTMYSKFIEFLKKQESSIALQQKEFVISELKKIQLTIGDVKKEIYSHKNKSEIEAEDLLRIQKLDALAKEQIEDLNDTP